MKCPSWIAAKVARMQTAAAKNPKTCYDIGRWLRFLLLFCGGIRHKVIIWMAKVHKFQKSCSVFWKNFVRLFSRITRHFCIFSPRQKWIIYETERQYNNNYGRCLGHWKDYGTDCPPKGSESRCRLGYQRTVIFFYLIRQSKHPKRDTVPVPDFCVIDRKETVGQIGNLLECLVFPAHFE